MWKSSIHEAITALNLHGIVSSRLRIAQWSTGNRWSSPCFATNRCCSKHRALQAVVSVEWAGEGVGGLGEGGADSESRYNLIFCFSSPFPPTSPSPSPAIPYGGRSFDSRRPFVFFAFCVCACECARIPAPAVHPVNACGMSVLAWCLGYVCFYLCRYAFSLRVW